MRVLIARIYTYFLARRLRYIVRWLGKPHVDDPQEYCYDDEAISIRVNGRMVNVFWLEPELPPVPQWTFSQGGGILRFHGRGEWLMYLPGLITRARDAQATHIARRLTR